MTATKNAVLYRKEGVQVDLPAVDLLEIGLCDVFPEEKFRWL